MIRGSRYNEVMIRFAALLALLVSVCSPSFAETFLIIPFFNLSKDANLNWIGESLSEAIREALAGQGAMVIDRDNRREGYRRLSMKPNTLLTKASVVVLGEAVDADQVIYGSYELLPSSDSPAKSRGSLRITAQILDRKKMTRGPEYMEVGALEDLARLQTHLAWQTLEFSTPKTAPSEQEFRNSQPAIRLDAIENYVRGLLANSSDQKMNFLLQAVRLDPKYSQANYQLGRLLYEKKSTRAAADTLQKVVPTDDHFREATFLLGLCRFYLGDYQGAQESFQLVSQTVPLNEVLNNLGVAQLRRNLLGNALQNLKKALDGDTADPDYQFNVGYALYKLGNFPAAMDRFRAVLERVPEYQAATVMLGLCLKQPNTRAAETRSEGLERLKTNYEESAYWQLKAVLEPKR
jgi:tetratricopeptide (TPR) repeat protein